MGARDLEEHLAACHEVNVENEATNRELVERLRGTEHQLETARRESTAHLARCDVLEAQIAELEHENLRLEGALRDALRHESHTAAALAGHDLFAVPRHAGEEGAAAVRMLAAVIRNLPAIPPDQLDAIADLLTPPPTEAEL